MSAKLAQEVRPLEGPIAEVPAVPAEIRKIFAKRVARR